MLYLLYTSGTTAKPKGILHTTGGYLTRRRQPPTAWVFDIKDDDIYWAAADIGWVTGHSYIVYGPLANGTTGVMYEGTPDYPDPEPLVGDHRALQGHDPLHRPDRHPRPHEVGPAARRKARSLVAAPPRHRRRADQPRSLDLVPRPHRRRAAARSSTPGGRPRPAHHDLAPPRPHHDQTRLRHLPAPRHRRRCRRRPGRTRPPRRGRLPRPHPALALDAARHLRRPRALQGDLLEQLPRHATSPATAPAATRTATTGCSAASTT